MSQYLVFQLHGPMASWGADAPGEVRHTHDLPTRSALLGLLAAALGIRRDDDARLAQFHQYYEFILRASKHPRWARDYHTIQTPKEVRKVRYYTRRDELREVELRETLISKRDYYSDAWWMVAVAATNGAPYSLASLQHALTQPFFTPYLGRKSHPLALPLMPIILEGKASDVLRQAQAQYVQMFRELKVSFTGPNTLQEDCWWEGEHEGLLPTKILRRRDQPGDRRRWLFHERDIFQGTLDKEAPCTCQK